MDKKYIILSISLFALFCGCINSSSNVNDAGMIDLDQDSSTSQISSTSTTYSTTSSTTTTSSSTSTTTTTTTTTTSTTTTSSTTTTTLPEFLDARVHRIEGNLSTRATPLGLFNKISAPENCDGEPCGVNVELVPSNSFSSDNGKPPKLCIIGLRLANFGDEDIPVEGIFSIELADGKNISRTCSTRNDLLDYYLDCSDRFTVPSGGVWANKLVFNVPRDSEPVSLIYASAKGTKYRYNLDED